MTTTMAATGPCNHERDECLNDIVLGRRKQWKIKPCKEQVFKTVQIVARLKLDKVRCDTNFQNREREWLEFFKKIKNKLRC